MAAVFASPCMPRSLFGPSPLGMQRFEYVGREYEVIRGANDLGFYSHDENGAPLRTFASLERFLTRQDVDLRFATNGGIFEPDLNPTGLWIIDGRAYRPLNLADGDGNFYLKPNGVFFSDGSVWRIVPSDWFAERAGPVTQALQSGPLLVGDGAVHPEFSTTSESRLIRSGVGVTSAGEVVLALSRDAVTFYEFATFFRDYLECPNALYLDGVISQFFVPRAEVEAREYAAFLVLLD